MNSENIVLDYLPYIDKHHITKEAEQVIRKRMEEEFHKIDTSTIHPIVSTKYPDIQQNINVKPCDEKNIGDKYSNIMNESNEIDEQKLTIMASYSLQRESNLEVYTEMKNSIDGEWKIYNKQLDALKNKLDDEIVSKKRKIDELKIERKTESQQFKQVNDFLTDKWVSKNKELVDIGVEYAKQELQKMENESKET
ncbi:unnamed protein product [Ambrosiozyma monospora]|uniref:Unnamed protein product n=1 Tax=Ambrosiozyma monospora TaxID=43982 RepID=A0ACB5T026_AMBMO|nr:unnamed protein product [Ambrosiozyma monospora]